MISKSLVVEFIKAKKHPIGNLKTRPIECIKDPKKPKKIRFPGGEVGILSLFLAGANLYGYKFDAKKFNNFFKPKPHKKTCFHLNHLLNEPSDYFLEKEQLKTIENLLSESDSLKNTKENLLFIISGNFTVEGRFLIPTKEKEKEIQALVINIDEVVNFLKKLCFQILEKEIIKLNFNLQTDYLQQVILDLFQEHFWQSLVKEYKNTPIYKVSFLPSGNFKLEDMGRI